MCMYVCVHTVEFWVGTFRDRERERGIRFLFTRLGKWAVFEHLSSTSFTLTLYCSRLSERVYWIFLFSPHLPTGGQRNTLAQTEREQETQKNQSIKLSRSSLVHSATFKVCIEEIKCC